FPEGSYVVRMDQPYSRMADMLLDTQYYNISDPRPYDDSGWSLGALRNVKTVRVTEGAILQSPMTMLTGPARAPGGVTSTGTAAYLIAHHADNALATLRFQLRPTKVLAAEEKFTADGREYPSGSFIIPANENGSELRRVLDRASAQLGVAVHAATAMPSV